MIFFLWHHNRTKLSITNPNQRRTYPRIGHELQQNNNKNMNEINNIARTHEETTYTKFYNH